MERGAAGGGAAGSAGASCPSRAGRPPRPRSPHVCAPSPQVHDGDVIKHGMVNAKRLVQDWQVLQAEASKEGR